MKTKALLMVVLAAAPLSCRKPKVAHEYLEASGEYSILVARMGDDAYADPQMDQIVAKLGRVPGDSSDAPAAQKLKDTIAQERKRVADEAEQHRRTLSAVDPANFPAVPSSPSSPDIPPPPDAGGGEVRIQAGMTEEELLKIPGGCFRLLGPVKLRAADKTDVEGRMYERSGTLTCHNRWPKLEGKLLAFRDGKLQGEYDKTALKQEITPPPGAADAGVEAPLSPPRSNIPPAGPPPAPPGSQVVPAPAQNDVPAPR